MKQVVIALAVATTLSGCASIVERDDAQIVPSTVSVGPYGRNYKITALVEAGGNRKPVYVVATACQEKHGAIWDDAGMPSQFVENALLNGNKPEDKMFTQLCNQGLPLAEAMNDRVTPEQRDATLRAMVYQMQLERAQRPVVVQPAPVIVQPVAPSSLNCTSNEVGKYTYTNCR